jgi:hypothetical protein
MPRRSSRIERLSINWKCPSLAMRRTHTDPAGRASRLRWPSRGFIRSEPSRTVRRWIDRPYEVDANQSGKPGRASSEPSLAQSGSGRLARHIHIHFSDHVARVEDLPPSAGPTGPSSIRTAPSTPPNRPAPPEGTTRAQGRHHARIARAGYYYTNTLSGIQKFWKGGDLEPNPSTLFVSKSGKIRKVK